MQKQPEIGVFWRRYFERKNDNQLSKQFNSAAAVEAILWLHYGVELGIIAREEAELFYSSYGQRLRSAFRTAQAIPGIFSSQLVPFFANVLRGEPIFDSEYTERLDHSLLNPTVMQMLFDEVARTNSYPLCEEFCDALAFDTDSKWASLISRKINPDKVLSGTGTRMERVCAGYFAALDHMDAMDELLQYCGDESVGKQPVARGVQGDQTYYALSSRIRLMHQWRIKLDDPVIKNRFVGLTYKLQEQLDADSELSSCGFDSSQFLRVVQSLCTNWLGGNTFTLNTQRAA